MMSSKKKIGVVDEIRGRSRSEEEVRVFGDSVLSSSHSETNFAFRERDSLSGREMGFGEVNVTVKVEAVDNPDVSVASCEFGLQDIPFVDDWDEGVPAATGGSTEAKEEVTEEALEEKAGEEAEWLAEKEPEEAKEEEKEKEEGATDQEGVPAATEDTTEATEEETEEETQDCTTDTEATEDPQPADTPTKTPFIIPKSQKKVLSPFSSLCSLFTMSKNVICEEREIFKNNNLNNSNLTCCPLGGSPSLKEPLVNLCQVRNNMEVIKKSPKSKNKNLFVTLKAVNSNPSKSYRYYEHYSGSEGSSPSSSSSSSSPSANPGASTSPEDSLSSPSSENKLLGSFPVPAASDLNVTNLVHVPYAPSSQARFKLMLEGDVQIYFLNHTRTILNKVSCSKFLRRWENHHIYLRDDCISSKVPGGCLEKDLPYSHIEEVHVMCRWDQCSRYCIRLVVRHGSLLLQTASSAVGDQLHFSLLWRKNVHKHKCIILSSSRYDVIMKEIKGLIQLALAPPILDETVVNVPINVISQCLVKEEVWCDKSRREELIRVVAPMLEDATPSPEMCDFFSQHCCLHPRSPVIAHILTPIVHRILKRNVDFGKSPVMRRFVADFLSALHSQNDGDEAIRRFVASIHGPTCCCPHPRVLPNLVSVNLSAVFSYFDARRKALCNPNNSLQDSPLTPPLDQQLQCYATLFVSISEYDDWLPGLAQLLQPIPFPDDALSHDVFMSAFTPVMARIGCDSRCDVHEMVLGIRENKSGWLQVYCPSSLVCNDEGVLWCQMLRTLFGCCCRRKRFLQGLVKNVGALLLVALRDHDIAQEMLCLMLEWRVVTSEDQEMHIVTTLQSTTGGARRYRALCERQQHLKELQKKGGPRKLTLPNRSTDADVACLLSCGAFGNLECLSLAFTHVTSACAYQLIQLPALRYLNLWATQFGDAGLVIISEHLDKLQVLNLCETPVSDKGIVALTAMTSLKKLNLNSTKLSPHTLETLKKQLPTLQELDVRYTDAW